LGETEFGEVSAIIRLYRTYVRVGIVLLVETYVLISLASCGGP